MWFTRRPAIRIVCLVALTAGITGCADFAQRCQSLGLRSGTSSYAGCVNDRHLALEATLFSIANGFSAR